MKQLKDITPLEQDFSQWYIDVVVKGNLMSYGPVKGTIIFKPLSYGLWENIQKNLDNIFKKMQVQNVYFPVLIPKDFIAKEKSHVKGFSPELLTVTKFGDQKLETEYVVRPSSEVVFSHLFANEINSYKDLPLIYNQWANVMRWEKKTNPFLRTSEFLWQEGHTIHETAKEAKKLTKKMIQVYADFCKKYLAIPTVIGKKTNREKFAGAQDTYTIEAMMKDGKSLQAGTSHYLGQNFAKAFNISFKNQENTQSLVHQTSWGVSTRLIGGIIMTHGDNRGIIMPPMVAPVQVDICPIFANKDSQINIVANKIANQLKRKFRVRVDHSDKNPGFKASQSEIQGTPVRIDIGPRDIVNNNVEILRRDTLEKKLINIDQVNKEVDLLLKDIHKNLYETAVKRMDDNFILIKTYDEFKKHINDKRFVLAPFVGSSKDEEEIQVSTQATPRCIVSHVKLDKPIECFKTGKLTKRIVLFARSY